MLCLACFLSWNEKPEGGKQMSLHPSVFIIILLGLVDIFDTEVMKRLYETWLQGRFRETTFEEKKVTEARGGKLPEIKQRGDEFFEFIPSYIQFEYLYAIVVDRINDPLDEGAHPFGGREYSIRRWETVYKLFRSCRKRHSRSLPYWSKPGRRCLPNCRRDSIRR